MVPPVWQSLDRSLRKSSSRRQGISSEPTTPEQQQQQPAARRTFGSASAGRTARERLPPSSSAASPSPATPSWSLKSRASSSTPATARRLFPSSSLHTPGPAAAHLPSPTAIGSPARRRWAELPGAHRRRISNKCTCNVTYAGYLLALGDKLTAVEAVHQRTWFRLVLCTISSQLPSRLLFLSLAFSVVPSLFARPRRCPYAWLVVIATRRARWGVNHPWVRRNGVSRAPRDMTENLVLPWTGCHQSTTRESIYIYSRDSKLKLPRIEAL